MWRRSLAAACEKVPLLAPTGSTITLTTATNALPVNGTATIVAQVLEAGGTPPHSGTAVNFTTSLGTIEPADAQTDASGRVTVTFTAGNANGTASIAAASGGASTGTNGLVRIAVGAAAVGQVIVGGRSDDGILSGRYRDHHRVGARHQRQRPRIGARRVHDNGRYAGRDERVDRCVGDGDHDAHDIDSGDRHGDRWDHEHRDRGNRWHGRHRRHRWNRRPGGTGGTGGTAGGGTTSSQASGSVTIGVNAIPTVSIAAATTGTLVAGSPVTFTMAVTPGANSTAQIANVLVEFGDGTRADLGAVQGATLAVSTIYKPPVPSPSDSRSPTRWAS